MLGFEKNRRAHGVGRRKQSVCPTLTHKDLRLGGADTRVCRAETHLGAFCLRTDFSSSDGLKRYADEGSSSIKA
jgi:hypothetical protein